MTRKLYQEDVYKKECDSTILELRGSGTAENPYLLILDETIFFPVGGGQPCDLGTIGGVPLSDVYEENGVVFHKLIPQKDAKFETGLPVQCILDWARRFEHMQRHCGEHILSGIFFRECGGLNRGFHMGSAYMTIDIDVPGIPWEEAQKIETITNEIIWANVPVTTRYFENREDAEKLPLRKALAIDEDISIVCVGDEGNPADCVACCGTHPSTSGQVGLVKILKLESYKGMTRVYFKAGREALLDYQNKHTILTELNRKYSADDNDLLDKVKAQDERSKEVRQELHQLKTAFIAKSIDEIIKESEANGSGLLIHEYAYFKVNDLLTISRTLTERSKGLIVLISTQENTVILATSGKLDCGKIVKDNAPVWRGKGGGNAAGSRAMFPSRDELDCFLSFINQAYRNGK